ncbi:MAG: hypothetical protein H6622_09160 [Halobacteriovoraceae bacterium]|nr:hypothetical protein [Halobacteriovoraceae bacterium]
MKIGLKEIVILTLLLFIFKITIGDNYLLLDEKEQKINRTSASVINH